MNNKLKDLLTTELRKQIYQSISAGPEFFTIADLIRDLASKDIKTNRTTVQQLLQGLIIRRIVIVSQNHAPPKYARQGRHQNIYFRLPDATPS